MTIYKFLFIFYSSYKEVEKKQLFFLGVFIKTCNYDFIFLYSNKFFIQLNFMQKAVKTVIFDLTTLSHVAQSQKICGVYETKKFNFFRDKY